jgi:peptidoglycan/LPS O-acetylase OafA/YrhL
MYMNFALAPSAALLIFCAARYRNIFSTWLTSRPALVLGDSSYSIYLVHYLVLMVATKLIGLGPHGVVFGSVAIVLSITAVLVISILLYTYYESPARKWLRRLWR